MSEEAAATVLTQAAPETAQEAPQAVPQEAPTQPVASGNWRDSLPEDLRESGSLRDIPDVNTLAKAYQDAQSYIGRSIRIPGEDANEDIWSDFNSKLTQVPGIGRIPTENSAPEEWDQFYQSMGRPESADQYRLGEDGRSPNETESALLDQLHSLGLNNKQASGLVDWMNQGVDENFQNNERAQAEALSQLKTDWGQAFDSKIKDAKAALVTYGGEELTRELEANGLGNNTALIKAFAEIGHGFSEDSSQGVGGKRSMSSTPAEAKIQIDEILGNPAHPYNDINNPAHEAAVDSVQKLYQAAYLSDENAEPDIFEQKLGLG